MRANLELTHGALYSQRALTALIETGMTRDDAYRLVQEAAQTAWDTGTPFRRPARRAAHRELGLERSSTRTRTSTHVPELLARLDRSRLIALEARASASRRRITRVPPRGERVTLRRTGRSRPSDGGPQLDRAQDRLDRDPHLELREGGADAAPGAAAERDPARRSRAASSRKRSGRNAYGSG